MHVAQASKFSLPMEGDGGERCRMWLESHHMKYAMLSVLNYYNLVESTKCRA